MKLKSIHTQLLSLAFIAAAFAPATSFARDEDDITTGLFLIASFAWTTHQDYPKEQIELARVDAKEFLLGGEMSESLRDAIDALRAAAKPAADQKGINLNLVSDLEIARLIYTGKVE